MGTDFLKILFLVWFCFSILIEVIGNVLLWWWLRRRGVKMVFALAGMPGYLDRLYREYCRNQGRSGESMLLFRKISLINVIAAAVVGFLVLGGELKK